MELLEFLNPRITWRGTAIVALVGLPVVVAFFWISDPFGRREIESKLRLGLTEAEVVRLLGAAPAASYDRDTAPANYYVEGWSRRERPITHRVLIFHLGEPICYVWLDKGGLVEDFYVGGS